jgi:DNA polymerase-3 subunit alpha
MSDIVGFEHLHRHTDFSLLDGFAMVEEYAEYSKSVNQKFLCVSDHGAMGCGPRQIAACDKHGLHPIFACELYINPYQPKVEEGKKTSDYMEDMNEEEKKRMRKSNHLLAIAYTNEGYTNLCKMSSWAWKHGFYYFPRINHEILQQHKKGIIFTTCCYSSEIGYAFDKGGAEAADAVIENYIRMIGKENLLLEVMMLDFEKQAPYNLYIQTAAVKYGLDWILTQDCHYCKPGDSKFQRYQIMIQRKRTIAQIQADIDKAKAEGNSADIFELQDGNLWMKSEEELNLFWETKYKDNLDKDFFQIGKANTVKVCERAKGVKLDRSIKLPLLERDEENLKEAIARGFKFRQIPLNKVYIERVEEEFALIKRKGFCSYCMIEYMTAQECRRWYKEKFGGDGSEAMGPGRGSAVGCLIFYLLGVTDVDPVKHDLLFSRFLSPARGGKQMKLRFSISPIITSAV